MTRDIAKMFISLCFDLYSLIKILPERSDVNIPIKINNQEAIILGWRCDFSVPEIKILCDGEIDYLPIIYLDSTENALSILKELSLDAYNLHFPRYLILRKEITERFKDKENISDKSTIEDLSLTNK